MCGFCHSTFVTEPTSVTGLLASNSAAKEWCAWTGSEIAAASAAPAVNLMMFIGEPPFSPVDVPALVVHPLRGLRNLDRGAAQRRKEVEWAPNSTEDPMRVALFRTAGLLLAAALALPAAAQYGHPLKGSWSGDWGPTKDNRTRVLLDINWDGKALTGVINP